MRVREDLVFEEDLTLVGKLDIKRVVMIDLTIRLHGGRQDRNGIEWTWECSHGRQSGFPTTKSMKMISL